MKKILLCIALCACMAGLSSCNNAEKNAHGTAESFLRYFYSLQYEKATDLCTPGFAPFFRLAGESVELLPEDMMAKVKESAANTRFEIVSVDVNEEAGEASVGYDLYLPDSDKPVRKNLSLKLEGRTALVDGIK